MKQNLIESPPRTIMEVYKNLPEGTLAELIDNVIYMSPSPIYKHQSVLQSIFRKLCAEITDKQRGEVIIAPFDVYLDETGNAVQPDIVVILEGTEGLNQAGHFHGVPDLLVEVLSSGNKSHDLVKKKDLYERFGVKEYWTVDPETKLAQGFQLKNGKYTSLQEQVGKIESPLLTISVSF
jgi:Uma2 family endonuclease